MESNKNQGNIMVVGSNDNLCQVLSEMLCVEGYSIVLSENEDETIKILRGKSDIDMIMAEMPSSGVSSNSFYQKVLSIDTMKSKPFIYFSYSTNTEDIIRILVGGADDYISIPFDPNHVIEKVRDILGKA